MTIAKTKDRKKQFVVFDVEGVLLPKKRYLLFDAARKLGPKGFIKIITLGFLYEVGLLPLESALRRIFSLYQGFTVNELYQIYKTLPLIPGGEELFEELNTSGYKTALISSGLPTLFVRDLATRLKADYAFGLEIETKNGKLTGEIGGEVIKTGGKAAILKRILDCEDLAPKNCAMVADDRNNLQMFPLCGLRIGYNPDFVLSAKSDRVV
nr:HAD-IB family phosphatase [Candidatus Bathyarchaeota archaeon]NIU81589.1 HAD-IB family phosphatase [Candidatus Bathyarchaeota archaeon]NIV68232.1 HAD-IB family phosphatase [Candidatus Bathyarchaeota archaeon]NIW16504.1 HAD-IB family phosphatase [Candidatus Bathyarchaeota archaeon]NIW34760.1 HAD-IB family phosphatase [Candidatus Bathyarchaeota archaeon]